MRGQVTRRAKPSKIDWDTAKKDKKKFSWRIVPQIRIAGANSQTPLPNLRKNTILQGDLTIGRQALNVEFPCGLKIGLEAKSIFNHSKIEINPGDEDGMDLGECPIHGKNCPPDSREKTTEGGGSNQQGR